MAKFVPLEPLKGSRSPTIAGLQPSKPASPEYEAAIAYLYGRINYERTADTAPYPFRLRRMNELIERLDLLGVAGGKIPVVHIAGTKGKGSTSTMVASMLSAAGYRTGLYTSPHLLKLEERFTIDGTMLTEVEVVALVDAIRRAADSMAASDLGAPTFFELTTAIALLHFRNSGCDAVVLEVGLGGKLDSTNICQPAVTAITSIGYDHQHILGSTLTEIASQKAGIIKPGVPIVSGVAQEEAYRVVENQALANGSKLYAIGQQFDSRVRSWVSGDEWTMTFDVISHSDPICNRSGWDLPLDGEHQAANAAVACVIIDLLNANGTQVPIQVQRQGLSDVKIAGRVERFRLQPGIDLILDASHNIDSIMALCKCIQKRASQRPVTIVFGTSRDKEHQPMLTQLCRQADALVLTRYHANPRYRDTSELLRDLPAGQLAIIEDDPCSAVKLAIRRVSGPHLVVVCGSFFLAAEVRPMLQQISDLK